MVLAHSAHHTSHHDECFLLRSVWKSRTYEAIHRSYRSDSCVLVLGGRWSILKSPALQGPCATASPGCKRTLPLQQVYPRCLVHLYIMSVSAAHDPLGDTTYKVLIVILLVQATYRSTRHFETTAIVRYTIYGSPVVCVICEPLQYLYTLVLVQKRSHRRTNLTLNNPPRPPGRTIKTTSYIVLYCTSTTFLFPEH